MVGAQYLFVNWMNEWCNLSFRHQRYFVMHFLKIFHSDEKCLVRVFYMPRDATPHKAGKGSAHGLQSRCRSFSCPPVLGALLKMGTLRSRENKEFRQGGHLWTCCQRIHGSELHLIGWHTLVSMSFLVWEAIWPNRKSLALGLDEIQLCHELIVPLGNVLRLSWLQFFSMMKF